MSIFFSKLFWMSTLVMVLTLGMAVNLDAGNSQTRVETDSDPEIGAVAEIPESARLKLTTNQVVVFKDGYCLVVKEAVATTDDAGRVYTDEVPDSAVLGSFWAVPEQGQIRSMVAGWKHSNTTSTLETDCVDISEIIGSNLGSKCTFDIGTQNYRGTLLKLLPNRDTAQRQEHFLQSFASLNHATPVSPQPVTEDTVSLNHRTSSFFILSTEVGEIVLPIASVQNLTIDAMKSTVEKTVTRKTTHKRISITMDSIDTPVKIRIMYFRPDVRWIPTYRIDLTDRLASSQQKQSSQSNQRIAEIFMQGEIINEAEDFADVPFHLVVGVPNFRFRDVPSPMVLESTMRNALAQAAPSIMGYQSQMSNAIFTQRAAEYSGDRKQPSTVTAASIELPSELTSSAGNDLFVYKLGAMSLEKGERATVPILRTEVPYRDVYTWNVELPHAETYAATGASTISPLVLSENKVWRQIELINDTELPWTTGAAMFVDGFQPIAQELLTYTSPGGVCRIPVTIAVDLRGRIEDAETDRELQKLVWRGNQYARVSGKIHLELENQKQQPVNVEINLQFGGEASTASDDGKVVLRPFNAEDWHDRQGDAINNSSQVKWRTEVEPGGCFQPTVEYAFWLRY